MAKAARIHVRHVTVGPDLIVLVVVKVKAADTVIARKARRALVIIVRKVETGRPAKVADMAIVPVAAKAVTAIARAVRPEEDQEVVQARAIAPAVLAGLAKTTKSLNRPKIPRATYGHAVNLKAPPKRIKKIQVARKIVRL